MTCRKLEIAQDAKCCSKRKKLLEKREVAKKLPRNLWKALLTLDMVFFFSFFLGGGGGGGGGY